MTVKAETEIGVAVKMVHDIGNQLKKQFFTSSVQALQGVGVIDNLGEHIHANLPGRVAVSGITEAFKEKFLKLTAEGYVPEVYFGHFTHLDHIVLSEGLDDLVKLAASAGYKDKLQRFAITLATSVRGGQQSPFMKAVYPMMESYVKARSVDFIAITRADKDVTRYGMKPKISEKRPLIAALRQGNVGMAIPAGDSVEPGRHPKGKIGDNIKGLQEVTGSDLVDVYMTIERHRPAYFLPTAVSNTWLYFNSDRLLPTPEALAAFYCTTNLAGVDLAKVIDRLGIRHDIAINITFGMPITQEQIVSQLGSEWRKNPAELNSFLMIEQASLLPEHARGYYADLVRNHQRHAEDEIHR